MSWLTDATFMLFNQRCVQQRMAAVWEAARIDCRTAIFSLRLQTTSTSELEVVSELLQGKTHRKITSTLKMTMITTSIQPMMSKEAGNHSTGKILRRSMEQPPATCSRAPASNIDRKRDSSMSGGCLMMEVTVISRSSTSGICQ